MAEPKRYTWRLYTVFAALAVLLLALLWRLVDLNILQRNFLMAQSKARILRRVKIPAHRGMIVDSSGSPLAISTPVDSVWVDPKIIKANTHQLYNLARILNMPRKVVLRRANKHNGLQFVYLKRHITAEQTAKVKALKIRGLFFQHEYARFYPEGAVTAHVVGLTNINDKGQEGLELSYNQWLRGVPGIKEVLKDRLGHIIDELALLRKPVQGKKLTLSLDHRIQYLAFNALNTAIQKYHAQSGSVVVLNVETGEVLAMVNYPSYNPNRRPKDHDGRYRNRAVTDTFEPGSVIKPFTIALALDSGKYTPGTIINTSPGWMEIGGYKIEDDGLDYGRIDLTQVLAKSSNIGAAKIMLSLKPSQYYQLLRKFGFGQRTSSGFPGEASGRLVFRRVWYPSVVATLAYGYGISVTTLQLAHAYSIFADAGIDIPVTFVKRDQPVTGRRVISAKDARTVVRMLESVVAKGGTGTRAQVPGYQVAGKTGTAYIAKKDGYDKTKFMASFVGMAPAAAPKLVVAVTIREPHGQHFGGIVAAPVFSKVMSGALRFLDIAPVSSA